MNTKTLCILANSVKFNGYCVAGIEIEKNEIDQWQSTGRWIRPIGHSNNGSISLKESYLHNQRRIPKLFDIIEIPLKAPAYVDGQPENWLIAPNVEWKHLGQINPLKHINTFLEYPDHLWLQENEKYDRVTPQWVVTRQMPSLYLIKPEDMTIYVDGANYGDEQRRSRRANFRYQNKQYDLAMTDPFASKKHFPDFKTRKTGINNGVSLNCAAICVSLAPAWQGELASQPYHYKLVAAIIEI